MIVQNLFTTLKWFLFGSIQNIIAVTQSLVTRKCIELPIYKIFCHILWADSEEPFGKRLWFRGADTVD